MTKVQVGIDLGTTNTLACCKIKGKLKEIKFPSGSMLPSVMYVEKQDDGSVKEYVGKLAVNKGKNDPDNCIKSSKTHIGLTGSQKKTWTCHGKTYTPTDVATKILEVVHKKVRETLDLADEDVVQAIITIPAYFSSTQSDETKRAGERAGMEILRIITEPVAAAVAAADDAKGKVFVVDLGGGTFDVSALDIIERPNVKYRTLDIGGKRDLGGDKFDELIFNYFIEHIKDDISLDLSTMEKSGLDYKTYNLVKSKVMDAAVEMKESLSDAEEYEVIIPQLFEYSERGIKKTYNFSISMTRKEFNVICKPLFDEIIKIIDDTVSKSTKFRKDEIEKIFLVGGSCYIPKIQEDVAAYFGKAPVAEQDRAMLVVRGAGKIADMWNGFTPDNNYEDPFDDMLEDIISHPMGIEVVGNIFSEILARGTKYPTEITRPYWTAYDNQTSVCIKVYEKINEEASDSLGGNEDAFDCYGSFELGGIKPAPAGATQIDVTFNYDRSRTLCVTAKDTKSGNQQSVILHKGENAESEEKTVPPTDFYLLIDGSGSMNSYRRMEEAKKACKHIVRDVVNLKLHRIGLVSFDYSAHLLCELTHNANKLIEAIDKLGTYGNTNMTDAIRTACEQLKQSANKKAIIIVTDGYPNSKPSALAAAEQAKRAGIDIAAIGVQDADSDYLEELASAPDLVFMVQDVEKLSEVFGKAVSNLLQK